MIDDLTSEQFRKAVRKGDEEIAARAGVDLRAVAFYPDDWVLVWSNPGEPEFRHESGKTIVSWNRTGEICPASIWNDPVARREWIATGVIPPETPELLRAVALKEL